MNELIKEEKIKTMIYEIRGKEVMLDSDLAKIYGCVNGTKTINQAVKRNIEKFPEDFYFQLTSDESKIFWSQIGTKKESLETRGGKFNKPYVFTEQGVAMLSSVLKTENAAKASVAIMRAFVAMRHFIMDNKNIYKSITNMNNKIDSNTNNIKLLNEKVDIIFSKFNNEEKKEFIFFEGQIYDSYSSLIELLTKAKKDLTIIDGYADKSTLDIIKYLKTKVTLIVKNKTLLKKLDIEKYNKQYNNLKIIYSDIFHDRFIIIDNKIIYHLGASLNHIGNKVFAINKMEDEEIIKTIINKIQSIS